MGLGEVLAEDLLHADLHGIEGLGNIEQHSRPVVGDDLQGRREGAALGGGPGDVDPAVRRLGVHGGAGIRAVPAVDGYAVALGDEADDVVARDRRAAAGELDHAVFDVLDHDAGILGVVPAGRLDLQQLLRGVLALRSPGRGTLEILADLAQNLDRGDAAVADGGVEIVQAVEGQLAQELRLKVLILEQARAQTGAAQLGLEAGPAADDVLLALLALEPLLDLGAGLVGFAEIEPVAGRTLGGFGGQDLHDVAVFQLDVVARDAVVDLGADHRVADAGVDGVGKVDRRGAGRQGDDLALRREDEDLVVEHIDLEGVDIVLGVGLLLILQQTADPFKFLFVAGFDAFLILPVGGNAVFGGLVHLLGADLDLEGDALRADDRGVQALVHIGLGRGDIVLEPPRNRLEHLMDVTQNVVAVGDRAHDDAEGIEIVELVDGLVLGLHLAVDGIDVLDAAGDRAGDADLLEPVGDHLLDGLHELLGLLLVGVEIVHQLAVALGVQILQGAVLKLPLDLLHTEAVGQGGVNIHRLGGLGDLLGRGLILHRALVVQAVADLDQDHADVLGHRHEHLAQILHLLLLQRGELHAGQLGHALDQLGNGLAELLGNVTERGGGVLDAVVQEGAADGVGIQADLRNDLRHRKRVDDVGGAVLALLVLVLFLGEADGALDLFQIGIGGVAADRLHHGFIVGFKGFHRAASFLTTFGRPQASDDRAGVEIDLAAVGGDADRIVFFAAVYVDQALLGKDVQADAGPREGDRTARGAGDLSAHAGEVLPQDVGLAVGDQIPPDGHELAAHGQEAVRLLGTERLIVVEAGIEGPLLLGQQSQAAAQAEIHHVELDRPLSAEFVDLRGKGKVHAVAGADARLQNGLGEEDRGELFAAGRDDQAQVLASAHLGDLRHACVAQAENRRRTAGAAGLKLVQGADVLDGEQLRLHGAVHPQIGVRRAGGEKGLRHLRHPGPEGRDVFAADRKARRLLVAAVAFQQVGDLGQSGKEVEAAVAAGGGLALPLRIQADQKGRTVVFLGQAGGDDADHALVPGLPRQHDGGGLGVRAEHGGGLLIDACLHLLPVAVEAAEDGGKALGLGRVLRQKEAQGRFDPAHPSGCVDARCKQIADRGGGDRVAGAADLLHQRGDAGAGRMLQGLHAADDHRPHLAVQGHDVRHQPQAEQIGIAVQQPLLVAADGGGELEGNAHAGQAGVGIGAVRAVGVHHRNGAGQLRLALVMVGDDQVDAQAAAELRFLVRRDAAVHRDDQVDLPARELADGDLIETVALLQPRGNIAGDAGAEASEKVGHQGGGGDAVHVVVAEYRNMLLSRHGQADAVRSRLHVFHQKRRVQRRITAQIIRGARFVAASARGKHTGAERSVARLLQLSDLSCIEGRYIPGSKFHANTHPKFFFF